MKFLALISGGKDSFFNLQHCISQGHELIALGNLHPVVAGQDEIDSFMFQTVGHDVISSYAKCLDVPLYRQAITGLSSNQNLEYLYTKGDEIEDLFQLISHVQKTHPDLEAVSCGAILSHYQRTRVENVCGRLNLTSLTYLWQRDQNELMLEMCQAGLDARLVKVAAIGLNATHLGKLLNEVYPQLVRLNQMYQVHICGEGGEFETIVLDSPAFKHKRLEFTDQQVVKHSLDVIYLKFGVKVVEKQREDENVLALEAPPLLEENWREIYDNHQNQEQAIGKFEQTLDEQSLESPLPPPTNICETFNRLFINNLTPNETTDVSSLSLEEQTRNVFNRLIKILNENNLSLNDVQHVDLLLSEMASFNDVNKVYGSFFANIYLPPSRICVETNISTKLQLSCVVLKSKKKNMDNGNSIGTDKLGIHVRSRSFWGPQNIGPYSQSIVDANLTFKLASLSGQIPLIPATMELSTSGIFFNSILSMQHLSRVQNMVNVTNPAAIVCFITNLKALEFVRLTWSHYLENIGKSASENGLVIVEVKSLPRGANVEWGGFAFEEIQSMYEDEDDNDDDDEEEENGAEGSANETKIKHKVLSTSSKPLSSILETIEHKAVCSIAKATYNFHVAFTSDLEKIEQIMRVPELQVQIYASQPLKTISGEFIPVRKVYSHSGESFDFCVVCREELLSNK
ncbi:hypothetical protein LELG_01257 [Lodderomyces elongisporus NRRL YB-4239]|uniref:Diphthine--ammonia ligase n=1 Tax=Lodderomyces elongisporus (strain ATCC 11503 / CBS 2605 / JCM 1781 / NBRC 1676 / NRRL YB-4239) TaxID=379508 RepID=A5DV71_LODEL|nr:hypothetical protein LELG_01257 [Lodderomyces elongisporus NRRL YB-4239]